MVLCHNCGQSIKCIHCGKPVPEEDPNEYEHAACHKEWRRRVDAGKCMFCGTEDEHEPKSAKCSECVAMDEPLYTGYPGGA